MSYTGMTLTKSKTLIGTAIAIAVSTIRTILENNGIKLADTIWQDITDLIIGISTFYGVYGLRDAIRKAEIFFNLSRKEEKKK